MGDERAGRLPPQQALLHKPLHTFKYIHKHIHTKQIQNSQNQPIIGGLTIQIIIYITAHMATYGHIWQHSAMYGNIWSFSKLSIP